MSLNQFLLILHILAVAYGMGIGMSNFLNMQIAKTQTGDIAKGLAMHRIGMMRYTDIAIAGILLTGLLMVWAAGGVSAAPPWFHIKMAAVIVLVAAYGGMRMTVGQMMRTGNMALASRIAILSPILSLSAIVAVICAVLAFKA
jgi:uncharacterized membrane protein